MSQTAAQIAAAVRAGSLTARQAVEDALARIAAGDDRIGAFQVVRGQAALQEADAVDARTDKDGLPLAGVPIAIKDNVPVRGEPMRDGSAASDPSPSADDHEVVRRLRAAGAVVVGLTRVPELCLFGATDSVYGVTRNPWDVSRTPGGSSGGSAAAVAAGMVPIALGNDGLGSIRIPAACCGLVGIKPGFGVVPSELGDGSWFGMSENGPLATTVEDAALMLRVLADRVSLAALPKPQGLRIAVSTRVPMPGTPLDKHWRDATRATGELLRGAGHTVVEAHPPYGVSLPSSEIARWTAGAERDALQLPQRDKLEPRTRRHARIGRAVLALGFPHESGRTKWRDRAQRFFAEHDVLVTPTLAQPPLRAKEWSRRGWAANVWANTRYAPFAAPWNLAGWPAMAVPAGLDPRGLPLSVQLVAAPGGESLLLSLAAQLEKLRPWERHAPTVADPP